MLADFLKTRGLNEKIIELISNIHLSRQELSTSSNNKLQAILQYAVDNVPHYGKYKSADKKPTLLDFEILSRTDIQIDPQKMISRQYNPQKLRVANTSGSTGVPLVYYFSENERAWDRAALARALDCSGIKYGAKFAQIWGLPLDIKQRTISRLKYLLNNGYIINVFDLSENTIKRYLKVLKLWQPEYIYGYVSGIYQIALYVLKYKIRYNIKSLKLIVTTSEMLYPEQRKVIEKAFKCKVSQEYGAAEAAVIAFECSKGSLHINSDNVFVENDNKGNLLITTLRNYAMPLVRYKIGDIGFVDKTYCNCGLPFPIIKELKGRSSEMLVFNANIAHSEIFDYIAREFVLPPKTKIKEFRIRRIADDVVVVDVVPTDHESFDLIKNTFTQKIKDILGKKMEIKVNMVNKIEKDKSGKYRFFVDERKNA